TSQEEQAEGIEGSGEACSEKRQVLFVSEAMTSRERMLTAIDGGQPDHVPCAFMIFAALRDRCGSHGEFVQRQLEMGLDAFVSVEAWARDRGTEHRDVPGLGVRYSPDVEIREWRTEEPDGTAVLHKEYATRAGTLKAEVRETADWPYPGHVPLFDDFLVPRSRKFLVETERDLVALRALLAPPSAEGVRAWREVAREAREFAEEVGVLVATGWGVGLEACAWLCGIENAVWMAIDRPDMLAEFVDAIGEWNYKQMEAALEPGVDLYIRRGWYESTDFWSPAMFARFVAPSLRREARLAHEAGARFGYIMTSGELPLLEMIMDAGVDVLIGADPVQGKGTRLSEMRRRTEGRTCIWGGVNGFVTVETGSREDVRQAVREAMAELGPSGFILSPVDNVTEDSPRAWRNVEALIEAWREGW
ncbi:MAG: uroporphyrinogen decarboxylase family protein, partial [Armatimonadota bacterium]